MQGPEGAIPEDERIALASACDAHRADAQSSMSGMPLVPRWCGTSFHLGSTAGARPANRSAKNSWRRVRTLTLNWPVSTTAARVMLSCSSPTSTSAGSTETEMRVLAVRPRKPSGVRALTTTTPAASFAIASRSSCVMEGILESGVEIGAT